MSHVFISYARQDSPRAENLATALERSRIPVWWDPQIQLGDQFPEAIEDALNAATAVVVLWSRASIHSEWVIQEATIGWSRGVLLPVLLDAVQPPGEFAQLDCADLSNWNPRQPHGEFDYLRRELLSRFGLIGSPWQAERLDQNTLLVRLDHEEHTIHYSEWNLYVDDKLRVRGPASVVNELSFRFELNDGGEYYPAQLDVVVSLFSRDKVKRLVLEVGGRVLYQG
jgi:hypothetical protein